MFGTFNVGKVGGREFEKAGAGNMVGDVTTVDGGRSEIVGASDDEGGDTDRRELGAGIIVADGGAVGGVAESIGGFNRGFCLGDDVRMFRGEGSGEPARENCCRDS